MVHINMPGKKRSAKSAVVRPRKSSSRSRSPSGKKKRSKSARSATSKSRLSSAGTYREPDILDPPAMQNLYYIAHTAVDALEIRGFGWAEAPKGKKGKKGKKK